MIKHYNKQSTRGKLTCVQLEYMGKSSNKKSVQVNNEV